MPVLCADGYVLPESLRGSAMDLIGIDLAKIVELGTQIAGTGALRAGEMIADDVFEMVVGIAMLVYELDPH